MNEYQSLNHTKWECKYHIVWIPKYRKKKLYTELRRLLGEVLNVVADDKLPERQFIIGVDTPDAMFSHDSPRSSLNSNFPLLPSFRGPP